VAPDLVKGAAQPPRVLMPHFKDWRNPVGAGRPNTPTKREGADMSTGSGQETGQVTGTKDKDYNVIWFTEMCLSNALRLETYIADADRDGDTELADFFRKAQAESRKGAEQGKQMLKSRLSG